jgi:hypothetical protein
MEWTVLTISSCLPEEMSADSHRRREDPEREPVTKSRSYNPHIVLLQAPTHPSSSLESQRMYFPIDSPLAPARSPRPRLPYTGLPLLSQVQAAESMSISNQMLTSFTSSHSPQTRRQILTALLQACTPTSCYSPRRLSPPCSSAISCFPYPLSWAYTCCRSSMTPRP